MDNFELELRKKFTQNLHNNFLDNHDVLRFGKEKIDLLKKIKIRIFKNYTSNSFIKKSINKLNDFLKRYGIDAANCYVLLSNSQSKNLYLDLICFRILGEKKVKIFDTINFLEKRSGYNYKKGSEDKIPITFNANSWLLETFSIEYKNTNLNIISRPAAVFAEFIVEQYTYTNDNFSIGVEEGDYCIDAGACWGDSTMYFSTKAGRGGKVFAIEFIPGNLKILEKNVALNPNASNVTIIQRPLWAIPDLSVWYTDKGPASRVSFDPIDDADGKVNTYTIDQLVEEQNLNKLDFIKMDIEGAESFALQGAKNSLIRFKPKLAICIYHSLEDFTKIAQSIDALKLGYKFYLKHATIHAEETVLFAI